MRLRATLVAAAAAVALLAAGLGPSAAGRDAEWPELAKTFVSDHTPPASLSVEECTATGDPGLDVRLDCDDPFPDNEPNVAVDPADGDHIVVSSNDYGSCCDQYYTSFDAGKTWRTGNMSHLGPNYIGSDPITVFDPKHETVVHLSINFKVSSGIPATNGNVVASVSQDGGLTWAVPTIVGRGVGARLFLDKEDATVDVDPSSPYYGRIYVTWSAFLGTARRYLESPIMLSHSDDGGTTWSTPIEISGSSATYCTYQGAGPAGECDEDQGSSPRVGPGGVLHVAFQNGQHEAAWEPGDQFEDQYLLVTSHDGGATFTAPKHVVDLEDGTADFPTNVDDRPTLTGMQVRLPTFGSLAVDPTTGRLYLTFTDNRAGLHDTAQPVSNAQAYIMSSPDGVSWSAASRVDTEAMESWFPWVDVAADGTVGVVYNQRIAGDKYVVRLAEGHPGSFTHALVSQEPSRPNNSRYFDAGTTGCPYCAVFHGDYLGLDYGSGTTANLAWTDMRDKAPDTVAGAGDYLQFVYFARR
jgi:hypothetical protein